MTKTSTGGLYLDTLCHMERSRQRYQGLGNRVVRTKPSLDGLDFLGLQELGGCSNISPPWQILDADFDCFWCFYTCKPPLVHHAVAIGMPSRLIPFVEKVVPLSCGIGVIVRQGAIRTYVISAHLPHRQREDCLDTWQIFHSELEQFLQRRRHHDTIVILHDANYELGPIEA